MSKTITEETKNNIREYYLSQPMTLQHVADKFHLCVPTIMKILKDIPRYSKAKVYNPQLKENFFECINCEENAYFLGLIISDGNVFIPSDGNRQASISITLDLHDEYMLQTFKELIGTNTIIGKDGRGCGTIAVRSNKMANDLSKYGVIPRKSFYTYLPKNIPDIYMSHLIRGIFDGDGCIQAKMNNQTNHFVHCMSFCGTHQLMEDISEYCFTHLKLQRRSTVYDYKDRKLSETKISNKKDMYTFGEWLYKDATIFLKRKRDAYDYFKEHYNMTTPS